MSSVRFGKSYMKLGCKGGYTGGKRCDDGCRARAIRPAGGPRPVPRCADMIYKLVRGLCPVTDDCNLCRSVRIGHDRCDSAPEGAERTTKDFSCQRSFDHCPMCWVSVNKFLAPFRVPDQAPLRQEPVNWRLGDLCSQLSPSRVAQSHSHRILMSG